MAQDILHVRDEKAANTAGGSSVAGNQARDLNTVILNTISGASLDIGTGVITLGAGTYEIEAYTPAYFSARHRASLYNLTDVAYEVLGGPIYTHVTDAFGQNRSPVWGRFTLSGTKTFELRHFTQNVRSTNGLGQPVDDGRDEVYTDVYIKEIVDDFDLLHVQGIKSTNVNAGAASAGENIRALNTVAINEISGASLNTGTGVITLGAGTYLVNAAVPSHATDVSVAALRNKTDAGNPLVALGLPVFTDQGNNTGSYLTIYDQFIIHDTKDFELVHWAQTMKATDGLGVACNDGQDEVYAQVKIHKLISIVQSVMLV